MADPITANRSILNPADMAQMKQSGEFNSDMTVRQVMERLGIDVDGSASQLIEFQKKQMENANPLNKMKNIAGAGAPNTPPPNPMAGEGANTPPRGLDDLMKGM